MCLAWGMDQFWESPLCPHPTQPRVLLRDSSILLPFGAGGFHHDFPVRSSGVRCSLDKGRGSFCLGLSPCCCWRRLRQLAFPTQPPKMGQGEALPTCALWTDTKFKGHPSWLNSDLLKRNLGFPWHEAQRSQAPNGLQRSAIPTASAARGGFGLDVVVSEQETALPCENCWEGAQ